MSAYVPEVGDRVDITLKNALVTKVALWGMHPHLGARVEVSHASACLPSGAHFYVSETSVDGAELVVEKVTPPLPTTPGSVLRYDADAAGSEQTFLLNDDGVWRDACAADRCELGTTVDPARCTVIFDAGAES